MEQLSAKFCISDMIRDIHRKVENRYEPNTNGRFEYAFSYDNNEFREYVRNHVWKGIMVKFPDFDIQFDTQEQKFIVKW